jgi:hypothetical protein
MDDKRHLPSIVVHRFRRDVRLSETMDVSSRRTVTVGWPCQDVDPSHEWPSKREGVPVHPDVYIARIAGRQLQIITRDQALRAGLTDGQIRRRVKDGRLVALFPRVFLRSGAPPSPEQMTLAASLACGRGSFVSHHSAAALWGFIDAAPIVPEITVPASRRPRTTGIAIHRSRILGPTEHAIRGATPLATPARTLLGIAGSSSPEALSLMADRAFRRRLVDPDRLSVYLARSELTTAAGHGVLAEIAKVRCSTGIPESELEGLILPIVKRYRLPTPTLQYEVIAHGRRVRFDVAYPDQRVAVELDGWGPHYGLDRWQSDHDRHNATELSGWLVIRFTWTDLKQRPVYVAVTLAEALGLGPTGWRISRPRTSNVVAS